MSRNSVNPNWVRIGVLISPDLKEKLVKCSDEMDRSMNWIVIKAIENYLEESATALQSLPFSGKAIVSAPKK